MTVFDPERVGEGIAAAAARRADAGLGGDTTAFRLVHREADAMPGLTIDRLGDVAWVVFRDPRWVAGPALDALLAALQAHGVQRAVARYDRPANQGEDPTGAEQDAARRIERAGMGVTADAFVAHERGQAFVFRTDAGLSHGLFFDMRPVRHALAERWSGMRVLNLFAYTCGFGVALAGANEVTNVDVASRYLRWGEDNYRANALPVTQGAFVAKDAFAYLEVAAKVGNRFDAILLDPPTFSRGKRKQARRFRIVDDLEELVERSLDALAPGGSLFVSTNAEQLDPGSFERRVGEVAAARGRRIVERWEPGADYPAAGPSHLKTALVR